MMAKKAKLSLRKALIRTYWSVDDAMYYLTFLERNHSHLKDVGSTIETFNWWPDELYALWLDTEHNQQPRNQIEDSDRCKDEFEVSYFIQWAISKGLRITWLEWAIAERFLSSDIGELPTVASENIDNVIPAKFNHKEKRSLQMLIAALMHECKIDWTSRTANSQLRRLVENIGETLGEKTIRKVLTELANNEQIDEILGDLRGKIEPPDKQ